MDLTMDIAALSTQMHMVQLSQDVGTAMLGKSLDMAEDLGAGMVKMMEASVTPELGQNIDLYAEELKRESEYDRCM